MDQNEATPNDGQVAVDLTEEELLADRLRWAAESLAVEFHGVSPADAERLIFDVAREFLSDAKVAQFVPTFATRRARQVLRDRQAAGTSPAAPASSAPFGGVIAQAAPDLEVILDDDAIEVESSDRGGMPTAPTASEPVRGPASAPVPSPADYATEAKRLLERAKALRATALPPASPEE